MSIRLLFSQLSLILLLYVDGIVFVGENRPVARFVKNLQTRFKVQPKEVAGEFNEIEVNQDSAKQQIR